jgi:urease accessory protein
MMLKNTATRLPEPALTHTAARHGELRLRFACRGNQTVMIESFFRTPLQVMRATKDSAGCACVYMLSPTGGVVQGDQYKFNITVEENAHALVTTLAATKVYRMDCDKAVQHIHIEVMPNAVLEFLPDAAILFADAHFEQDIDIFLHQGALLMFQDSIMPGRLASGESLQFTRYRNRLTVRDQYGLLLYDMQDLMPQRDDLNRIGILEGYRCWASWYLLGDLARIGLEPTAFCEAQSSKLAEDSTLLGSASRLYRSGVVVRLLADYWSPLSEVLTGLWRAVRTGYMRLPAPSLRK